MTKIRIQGIKFDAHSTYQKGAKHAPNLIREALHSGSMNLCAENGISIDNKQIIDVGDYEIENYFDIETFTLNNLSNCDKLLTLGGDHSITFPLIRAYQKKYPKIDILHIDAHSDLYDVYENNIYSHACPFARIMENKLAINLVQVGIRTLNPHQSEQAKKFGVEIHQMKNWKPDNLTTFNNPVYISLDLDGFDPAFAPGVSHHEPGGLTSRDVISLIQNIKTPIIGADIVEYNPERDFQNMTAFLAAKMTKEILAKMMEN